MDEFKENTDEYNKKIYNVDTWQKLHVQQLAYTRNLVIILASAALGYTLTKINSNLICVFNLILILSGLLFLISIAIGFIIAYGESENYRHKYHIARNLLRHKPFDYIKRKCTAIENRNRSLIIIQIILFGIAILTETILIIIIKMSLT